MAVNNWVYVAHMIDMAQKGLDISAGLSREEYNNNEVIRLALTHIIQVIGEAANLVPLEFRGQHPEIPWHEIIGMRHRIVHNYLDVDEDIIWAVVQQDLPPLVTKLKGILPSQM
jgi:uncharacterized protein with HEPN domain